MILLIIKDILKDILKDTTEVRYSPRPLPTQALLHRECIFTAVHSSLVMLAKVWSHDSFQ